MGVAEVEAVEAERLGSEVGRAGRGGDEALEVAGDGEAQAKGEVGVGAEDDVLGPGGHAARRGRTAQEMLRRRGRGQCARAFWYCRVAGTRSWDWGASQNAAISVLHMVVGGVSSRDATLLGAGHVEEGVRRE